MAIKVNLKDVQTGFEPIDAGTYEATVTKGEMKEVSGNGKLPQGTPMISWEFTIKEEPYVGRKVFSNTVIHPNSLFTLKQLLAATGEFDEDDLNSDELEFEIEDVIGAEVLLVVTQREYEGEMRNNVKTIKPISSGVAKKAAAAKKGARKI